jgi:hypothetical protein
MHRERLSKDGGMQDGDVGRDHTVAPQPAQALQHRTLRQTDLLSQAVRWDLVIYLQPFQQGAVKAIKAGSFRLHASDISRKQAPRHQTSPSFVCGFWQSVGHERQLAP